MNKASAEGWWAIGDRKIKQTQIGYETVYVQDVIVNKVFVLILIRKCLAEEEVENGTSLNYADMRRLPHTWERKGESEKKIFLHFFSSPNSRRDWRTLE